MKVDVIFYMVSKDYCRAIVIKTASFCIQTDQWNRVGAQKEIHTFAELTFDKDAKSTL